MNSKSKWMRNERLFNKHIDSVHVSLVRLLKDQDPHFFSFFGKLLLIAENPHLTPDMYVFLIGRVICIILLDEFVVNKPTKKFIDKHIYIIHKSGPYIGRDSIRNMTFNHFAIESGKLIKMVLRKCGLIVEGKTEVVCSMSKLINDIDDIHKRIIHSFDCVACQSNIDIHINELIHILDVKRPQCIYRDYYKEFEYGFKILLEIALSYDMIMSSDQLLNIISLIDYLSNIENAKTLPFVGSNADIVYNFMTSVT